MNYYFTHFDELFREFASLGFPESQRKDARPNETCKLPKYPVSNCYVSDDQDQLFFEFALAGFSDEDVKVVGGKNSFTVRASKKEPMKSPCVLHHGISDRDVDFTINVDAQFDVKKAKVDLKNGLLTVSFPKTKDSKSVILFG